MHYEFNNELILISLVNTWFMRAYEQQQKISTMMEKLGAGRNTNTAGTGHICQAVPVIESPSRGRLARGFMTNLNYIIKLSLSLRASVLLRVFLPLSHLP
jgi:hypothetical protein